MKPPTAVAREAGRGAAKGGMSCIEQGNWGSGVAAMMVAARASRASIEQSSATQKVGGMRADGKSQLEVQWFGGEGLCAGTSRFLFLRAGMRLVGLIGR